MIIVRPARNSDLYDLASIHYHSLPDDFLPSLGQDFLEKVYYPIAITTEYAKTFVGESNGTVCGFITIASDSERFSKEVLSTGLFSLARYALRATFFSPYFSIQSLQVLWSVLASQPDEVDSEIVFIAVGEEFRGQGLGTILVGSAMQYLEGKLIRQCRTKTLADNTHVIEMYKKLGWSIRNRFRLINRDYVVIVSPLKGT